MNSKYAVIELTPTRLDVASFESGKRLDALRLPLDLDADPQEWMQQLHKVADDLRAAVEQLDVVGVRTNVIYRSPTQSVDLSSVAVTSVARACEAAELSCMGSLSYSAMAAVCRTSAVGRDGAGDTRQSHVIAAADRDDILGAIVDLVESAGLQFSSATPLDAVILQSRVDHAIRSEAPVSGMLHIGEHSCYFVVGGEQRLAFGRRVGFGLDMLSRSLTRPIRRADAGDTVELTLDEARAIIFTHGLAGRETIVHEGYGLTGAHILPLIQPVLQRFMVELRQSMRFGLEEEAKSALSLTLTGPGAHLHGLAALLGEELEVACAIDPAQPAPDAFTPASEGSELVAAASQRRTLQKLNMQPRELEQTRTTTRMKHRLWAGVAVAVMLVTLDAIRVNAKLDTVETQAASLEGRSADIDLLKSTGDKLAGTLAGIAELEATITTEMSTSADYQAIMHDLSLRTPESIEIVGLTFSRNEDAVSGIITGYLHESPAAPDAGSDQTDADSGGLEAYIAQLRQSPLYSNVSLGNVEIGAHQGAIGQRFEAVLTCIPVPYNAQGERMTPEPSAQQVAQVQEDPS